MTRYVIPLFLSILCTKVQAGEGPVAGMNRFATRSYRELAADPGNLILSPFNISTAVSMLLAGARGQTASGQTRVTMTSCRAWSTTC